MTLDVGKVAVGIVVESRREQGDAQDVFDIAIEDAFVQSPLANGCE